MGDGAGRSNFGNCGYRPGGIVDALAKYCIQGHGYRGDGSLNRGRHVVGRYALAAKASFDSHREYQRFLRPETGPCFI